MVLRIVLYTINLTVILALTLPHLLAAFRFYRQIRKDPRSDPLTVKLVLAIFLDFFDKAFLAGCLILLSVMAFIFSPETRDSTLYVLVANALFAIALIPSSWFLRSYWVDFVAALKQPQADISVVVALLKGIQVIMGSSQDVVLIVDTERNILSVSQGILALFGYEPEEVVGCKLEVLLPEAYRQTHPAYVAGFLASDEKTRNMGARRPVYGQDSNGNKFEVSITISKSQPLEGITWLVAIIRAVK